MMIYFENELIKTQSVILSYQGTILRGRLLIHNASSSNMDSCEFPSFFKYILGELSFPLDPYKSTSLTPPDVKLTSISLPCLTLHA